MTQITPDLLNAVMAKQGAPNTTDNLNRIAEFAAVNPGVLEQYIGQGRDASTVGNSITNSIASTDGAAPRGLADPNGYVSTVDSATGMSNIGPRLTQAPNIADPSRGGGGRGSPNAGKRGASAVVEPSLNPDVKMPTAPAAAPGDDSLGVPWWLAPFAARYLGKPQAPTPPLPPPFVQTPQGGLPAHMQPRAVATPDPNAEYAGRTRPGGGVTDVTDLNAQSIGQEVRAGLPPGQQGALPPPAPPPPGQPPRIDPSPGIDPETGKPMMKPGPGQTPQEVRNLYGDKNYENQQGADDVKNEIRKRNARPSKPQIRPR